MAEWIIFAVTRISKCSPFFKTPFTTVVLDGFLLLMKGSSLRNWLPFPTFFLDLVWQTMLPNLIAYFQQGSMVLHMKVVSLASSLLFKSTKHCSQGSSNCVKNANTRNQWNTDLKEAAIVSKMQTPAMTLWFPEHRFKENFYLGFFIKDKQFATQVVFLVKSKLWVLAKIQVFVCLHFFSRIFVQEFFFCKSRLCTWPLFSHFVKNLDQLAIQPILWIPPWGLSCGRGLYDDKGLHIYRSRSFLKKNQNPSVQVEISE